MSKILRAKSFAVGVCFFVELVWLLTFNAVSQFTLYGKMKKGNKPDFHEAADAQTARRVYDHFYNKMCSSYVSDRVKNGVFQAMMDVELKNDGPVGVDYRSEDAAVYTLAFLPPPVTVKAQ